ncbi:MAG: alkaline phosphatase, partial [Rubrivivax sp.]
MRPLPLRLFTTSLVTSAVLAALAACGGGGDDAPAAPPAPVPTTPAPEATPVGLTLEKIGGFSTGQFGVSAAEIPAFDAASKRLFVVNAQLGAVDVLDLSNPANPVKINVLDATAVLAGAEINSVAVFNGIVAVAIQAPVKTDNGRMALYRASDLALLGSVAVGALPDMVTFTPDGNTVLVANEAEPSDDYQIDPEGSVSVIDVRNPAAPVERKATFTAKIG